MYKLFIFLSLAFSQKIFSKSLETDSFYISQKEERNENDEELKTSDPLSGALQTDQVLLKGLNKITAQVQDIPVTIGYPIIFGTLEITARVCQKSSPEDFPDFITFLEITENKSGQKPYQLFKGWMFASSPAVSAIEHPVYDIWVQHCQGKVIKSLS